MVENAIGILKGRFPALRNLNMTLRTPKDEARAHGMILAACMLHNVILNVHPDSDGPMWYPSEDGEDRDEVNQAEDVRDQPIRVIPANQRQREEVCDFMMNWLDR